MISKESLDRAIEVFINQYPKKGEIIGSQPAKVTKEAETPLILTKPSFLDEDEEDL